MNRVQIPLPDAFLFNTDIAVHIGDINYGNHLANDALLRLCHEARIRFLHAFGYTEMNIAGAGLIMADAAIQFQSQAFHGDVLHFELGITDIDSAGFALIYQISRNRDGAAIARVKTGMVFFDYPQQKVTKMPAAFAQILGCRPSQEQTS